MTAANSPSEAAEGRVGSADLRLPEWTGVTRIGPWQMGDQHGWRICWSCTRCQGAGGNTPGPTLLLTVINWRATMRQHRRSCRPKADRG